MINIIERIKSSDCCCFRDEPMSKHTTFKIGGKADLFIEAPSITALQNAINILKENSIPYIIVGRGSNLLVSDKGIRGAVITLKSSLGKIMKNDTSLIYCAAGANLSSVCKFAAENGLSGLEFAYGIPGSVGGAVYMNAGAYGGEIKNLIKYTHHIDQNGNIVRLEYNENDYGYRRSVYQENNNIIIGACFELQEGAKTDIEAKMQEYIDKRKEKQPLDMPSAGSAFKRPEGYYAGELIEKSGLKGFSIGGAMVSDKHAGFIVNTGKATCEDVLNLIDHIKNEVYKNFGVVLEPEIKRIGE